MGDHPESQREHSRPSFWNLHRQDSDLRFAGVVPGAGADHSLRHRLPSIVARASDHLRSRLPRCHQHPVVLHSNMHGHPSQARRITKRKGYSQSTEYSYGFSLYYSLLRAYVLCGVLCDHYGLGHIPGAPLYMGCRLDHLDNHSIQRDESASSCNKHF